MNDDTAPDDPTAHDDSPADDPLPAIEASRLGPAQKKALRLLAEGQSYREAARQAGLRSTADLKRHAQRFGLAEVHNRTRRALVAEEREWRTAELIESMRQVAGKGAQELLRRLDEEPESIATRDLTVGVGIALDKIAKHERWDEEDSRERGVTPQVAELLKALGTRGSFAAQITVAGGVGEERCSSGNFELLRRLGGAQTEVASTDSAAWGHPEERAIDATPERGRN